MSLKRKTPPAQKKSPIRQSREITEVLAKNEFTRAKLHTAICHGLTAKEIEDLYKLVSNEPKV